jgi:CspA family cold shock protein
MSEIQMDTRRGNVKFYIDAKLFGFLIDDLTGEEIHVPVAGLIDEIKKNDKVTYRIENGKKGPEAVDVRVVKR